MVGQRVMIRSPPFESGRWALPVCSTVYTITPAQDSGIAARDAEMELFGPDADIALEDADPSPGRKRGESGQLLNGERNSQAQRIKTGHRQSADPIQARLRAMCIKERYHNCIPAWISNDQIARLKAMKMLTYQHRVEFWEEYSAEQLTVLNHTLASP